jgi:hypothetical protein
MGAWYTVPEALTLPGTRCRKSPSVSQQRIDNVTWIAAAIIGLLAGMLWETWFQLFIGAVGVGMMLGGYSAIKGVPWSAEDERDAFGSPQNFSKPQVFFFEWILSATIYFVIGAIVFGVRAML